MRGPRRSTGTSAPRSIWPVTLPIRKRPVAPRTLVESITRFVDQTDGRPAATRKGDRRGKRVLTENRSGEGNHKGRVHESLPDVHSRRGCAARLSGT